MAIFSYFLVVELKIKKNNILKDGRHNYSFILDSICILLIRKNKVNLISKYKKNKLIDLQLNTNFCIRNKHLGNLHDQLRLLNKGLNLKFLNVTQMESQLKAVGYYNQNIIINRCVDISLNVNKINKLQQLSNFFCVHVKC